MVPFSVWKGLYTTFEAQLIRICPSVSGILTSAGLRKDSGRVVDSSVNFLRMWFSI